MTKCKLCKKKTGWFEGKECLECKAIAASKEQYETDKKKVTI
jgi:hypothetical protein